ncbi:MAG: quinolinate synthase NadA [Thermodesulfobacteriota bacterium]|nr:quinolinate synthase NadA [Thermodesulfobacteriota bacterium]
MKDKIKDKIKDLVKEKNAIILAHNYQPPEIQDIADLCGDSLELSIKASNTDADIIVFCGVQFMAETASILSPDKKVLLPAKDAGCPMADMVTPDALRAEIKRLGNIPVVTYVNSTAAVKALSYICCTSANAVDVVNSIESREILMIPDKNLAQYAAANSGKKIHLWKGFCPYHNTLTEEDLLKAKGKHPESLFMAHPECPPEVLKMADAVESTSGMIRFAGESNNKSFIVGTETGLIYPLSQKYPDKKFYPASEKMFCPDMKKIKPADIINSLETYSGEVKVPENIRKDALKAVQRMIALKR